MICIMKSTRMNNIKYFFFINSLLNHDKTITMSFQGKSMEPTIPSECMIIVRKKPIQLQKNSIYVYSCKNKLICHRFIKKFNDNYLIFKGDNCLYNDYSKVTFKSIIGECIGYILNSHIVYFGEKDAH